MAASGDERPVAAGSCRARASPIHHVRKEYPPTLLLHGDKEPDVPFEESARMAAGQLIQMHNAEPPGLKGPRVAREDTRRSPIRTSA
jgi:BD-FAE protein